MEEERVTLTVCEIPDEARSYLSPQDEVLRVRLPEDFVVSDGPGLLEPETVGSVDILYGYLHVRPEWAAEVSPPIVREVHSRWLADYDVASDQILLRYDACIRPLAMPRGVQEVDEATRARAEERFAERLAEVRRRVREGETEQASFSFTLRDLEAPHVANNLLTLSQITRQAIGLFRNSNAFLQQMGEQWGALREDTARRAGSEARAMELLRNWLTDEQRESLQKFQHFYVKGSAGGTYRLEMKYSFGIRALRGGTLANAYCVVPDGAPSLGDILLAQKISLETDEPGTLAVANWQSG